MTKKYKAKPTQRQMKAVDGILIEGKPAAVAMRDAGYTPKTADTPNHNLAMKKGVQAYLETLEKKVVKRFNISLKDKVMETYLEGLEASKEHPQIVGRDEYGKPVYKYRKTPDHQLRGQFADRFARFFGWVDANRQPSPSKMQQFNFFAVPEQEQKKFNNRFHDFLKNYY